MVHFVFYHKCGRRDVIPDHLSQSNRRATTMRQGSLLPASEAPIAILFPDDRRPRAAGSPDANMTGIHERRRISPPQTKPLSRRGHSPEMPRRPKGSVKANNFLSGLGHSLTNCLPILTAPVESQVEIELLSGSFWCLPHPSVCGGIGRF